MIYGDPFKFALQFDAVDAWNVRGNEWRNGIFALYVCGGRLFDSVDSIELRTTFDFFKRVSFDRAKLGNSDVIASKIFEDAYEYFAGEGDKLMDGVVSLTCTAMSDVGLHLYLMKASTGERLIWSLDCGVTVSECILDVGEVASVIGGMPLMLEK